MEQHRAEGSGGEEYRVPVDGGADEQAVGGGEQPPTVPRIFLADASPGRPDDDALRGIWLDAAVEEEELEQAVHALLRTSDTEGPWTYSIGAAVGFEGFEVSVHESLATVARVARGVAEHGRAFVAYVDAWGTSQEAVDEFSRYYEGSWPSVAAWAEARVDDFGWPETLQQTVDASLLPYLRFDYERLGRDLTYDAHVVEDEERAQIHVFRLQA